MVEQIIINGQVAELKEGSVLSLELTSNILKKAEDYTTCYSYSYDLPNTVQNRSILGDLLTIGRTDNKVRRYLDAEYYRDGLQIFSGHCYVYEVTEETITVYFKFGINTALQEIKDDEIKLNELFNNPKDDEIRTYSVSDILTYKRVLPLTDRSQFTHFPFNDESASDTQIFALNDSSAGIATLTGSKLAVRAKRVFDLLNERYGLKVDTGIDTKYVWIQTAQSNRKDRFRLNFFRSGTWSFNTDNEIILYPILPESSSIVSNLIEGVDYEMDGIIFSAVKTKYRLDRIRLSLDIAYPASGTIVYTNVAKQAFGVKTFVTPDMILAKWSLSEGKTHIELDIRPEELGLEHEWEANDTGRRETVYNCGAIMLIGDGDIKPEPHNVNCLMDYSLAGNNVAVGLINSVDSLPSLGVAQFITDFLFGVSGEFLVNDFKGGKTLKSVNLEHIANNDPYDWSDKLVEDGLQVYPSIEKLAQNNYVKWATATAEAKNNHNAPTNDATLDKEEDFFVSNFGKMSGITNYTYFGGQSVVPSPKLIKVDFGRALQLNDGVYALTSNVNFDWVDYDTPSWQLMKGIFADPLRIECRFNLTSLDLATLDFTRPIYLKQFGAYFFADKLTVGEGLTEAVLIRLK